MTDPAHLYYEWICTDTSQGRPRRYKLRWRMTEAGARKWEQHPDNAGATLERDPHSKPEDRGEPDETPQVGLYGPSPNTDRSFGISSFWKPARDK